MFSKELQSIFKQFSIYYKHNYTAIRPSHSLSDKYQAFQDEWLHHPLMFTPKIKMFFTLTDEAIQGDTGANAFMPPQEIESAAKNLDINYFSGYETYSPSEKLCQGVTAIYRSNNYIDAKENVTPTTADTQPGQLQMTYSHGTTQAIDATLTALMQSEQDIVILPTPTYGLMLSVLKKHAVVKTVEQNLLTDYPEQLAAVIIEENQSCLERFKKQVALRQDLLQQYFQLDGVLQTSLAEMQVTPSFDVLDKLVNQYNAHLINIENNDQSGGIAQLLKLPYAPRVRALYVINPLTPTGAVLTQNKINTLGRQLEEIAGLVVIEDVVHRGIYLQSKHKCGSFLKSKPMHNRTITVDGLSKIMDLGRARTGIVIAENHLLAPIKQKLESVNCTYNAASLAFLEKAYSLTPHAFNFHLADMSEAYELRLNLVKLMVNGVEKYSTRQQYLLENRLKSVIKDKMSGWTDEKIEKYCQSIQSGIPHVKLVSEPEAGYFVLLDFTPFLNQYIGEQQITDSKVLWAMFNILARINTIPDILCYDDANQRHASYVRFSLSVDHDYQLVEAFMRIKQLLACVTPKPVKKIKVPPTIAASECIDLEKEEVQPSLLRQHPKRKRQPSEKLKLSRMLSPLKRTKASQKASQKRSTKRSSDTGIMAMKRKRAGVGKPNQVTRRNGIDIMKQRQQASLRKARQRQTAFLTFDLERQKLLAAHGRQANDTNVKCNRASLSQGSTQENRLLQYTSSSQTHSDSSGALSSNKRYPTRIRRKPNLLLK